MRRPHGVLLSAVVLAAALGLTGCPAQPAPEQCPAPPDGTWWGSWQSTAYPTLRRGVASATLDVENDTVSGTATLDGSGAGSGTVSGTVSCRTVSLVISGAQPFETMTVTATLSDDAVGSTMVGTYSSQAFTIPTTVADQPEQGHLLLGRPG